jgi:hypothetical protein
MKNLHIIKKNIKFSLIKFLEYKNRYLIIQFFKKFATKNLKPKLIIRKFINISLITIIKAKNKNPRNNK